MVWSAPATFPVNEKENFWGIQIKKKKKTENVQKSNT